MFGRVLITDWVIYAVKVFFHLFETNIFICMNILHHPEEKPSTHPEEKPYNWGNCLYDEVCNVFIVLEFYLVSQTYLCRSCVYSELYPIISLRVIFSF